MKNTTLFAYGDCRVESNKWDIYLKSSSVLQIGSRFSLRRISQSPESQNSYDSDSFDAFFGQGDFDFQWPF